MTLFTATLIPGLLLLALGAALLWNGRMVERAAKAFPRSMTATVVFFGAGAGWFLWNVANLSQADFGDYRKLLLGLFGVTAVAALFVVRDFLAVRGAAILYLLSADVLLNVTRWQPYHDFLAAAVYVGIVLALYFGALPYQLRDFFTWMWPGKPSPRPRIFGAVFAAYGLLLACIAFQY